MHCQTPKSAYHTIVDKLALAFPSIEQIPKFIDSCSHLLKPKIHADALKKVVRKIRVSNVTHQMRSSENLKEGASNLTRIAMTQVCCAFGQSNY